MATSKITSKLTLQTVTPTAGANVTISGNDSHIVGGSIASINIELGATAAISAYTKLVTGLPHPTGNVFGAAFTTQGAVYAVYVSSVGELYARTAITSGTTIRVGVCYAMA